VSLLPTVSELVSSFAACNQPALQTSTDWLSLAVHTRDQQLVPPTCVVCLVCAERAPRLPAVLDTLQCLGLADHRSMRLVVVYIVADSERSLEQPHAAHWMERARQQPKPVNVRPDQSVMVATCVTRWWPSPFRRGYQCSTTAHRPSMISAGGIPFVPKRLGPLQQFRPALGPPEKLGRRKGWASSPPGTVHGVGVHA
jgi:hypothetical protein